MRENGGTGTGCERGGGARRQFGLVGRAQNWASCAVDQASKEGGRFHCCRRGGGDDAADDPMAGKGRRWRQCVGRVRFT